MLFDAFFLGFPWFSMGFPWFPRPLSSRHLGGAPAGHGEDAAASHGRLRRQQHAAGAEDHGTPPSSTAFKHGDFYRFLAILMRKSLVLTGSLSHFEQNMPGVQWCFNGFVWW